MNMRSVRIRVLRNFTVEAIEPYLKGALEKDGIVPNIAYGGFASAFSDIAAIADEIPSGERSIHVIALGLEEAGPGFGHAGWPVADHCEQLLQQLRLAIDTCPGLVCINTLLAPIHDPWGMARGEGYVDQAAVVESANLEIRKLTRENAGRVALCDWSRYARTLGEAATYDLRFWMSARAPFARPFLKTYAADIARAVRADAGIMRKCLVLDCDNTLWGGVIGEDGLDGIALSHTSVPGRYFHEFQQSVVDLAGRGVLVALCSKNEEQDVLAVLDQHPESVLKRKHLAAYRINWGAKPDGLRELAAELGIGLDSFVFIDDSAIECDQVASMLPEVRVVRVPEHLDELPFFLHRSGLFESLLVTADDLARTGNYQQQVERKTFAVAATNLESYLRNIGTRISVRRCRDGDIARVVQLTQRTNQFNLTTRRYAEQEVRALCAAADARVYCAEIADRFGSLGLTAVLMAKLSEDTVRVEAFMVSCRALGRDAEYAFFGAALAELRNCWGDRPVLATFVPSPKNNVAAGFWPACGLSVLPGTVDGTQTFAVPAISALLPVLNRNYITLETDHG